MNINKLKNSQNSFPVFMQHSIYQLIASDFSIITQRVYYIERGFQDAKSELGMAQYEVRGWRGWHHHMALCCLAQLFSLRTRIRYRKEHPLMSVRDIVELLGYYLPRKNRDEAGVLAAMRARHAARKKDIRRRKLTQANLTK